MRESIVFLGLCFLLFTSVCGLGTQQFRDNDVPFSWDDVGTLIAVIFGIPPPGERITTRSDGIEGIEDSIISSIFLDSIGQILNGNEFGNGDNQNIQDHQRRIPIGKIAKVGKKVVQVAKHKPTISHSSGGGSSLTQIDVDVNIPEISFPASFSQPENTTPEKDE